MIKIKWFQFIRDSKYLKVKEELKIANLIIKGMEAHQEDQDQKYRALKDGTREAYNEFDETGNWKDFKNSIKSLIK